MRIGRLFGIEIHIHLSWLFVFSLVVWSLSSAASPFSSATTSESTRVLLAIFTALLFFASIVVHELAHSLTARARGIPVSKITLFLFGGVSSFEEEPATAPSAAWIALVGPLTSLGLGVAFFAGASSIGAHDSQSALSQAFGYLAFANVAIGTFNLLPAFPLDGGRVLYAILWNRLNDRLRATRVAAGVGRVLAWIMIALGIYETLFLSGGGGLWITFIGWFLLDAGQSEALQAQAAVALKGHSALELAEPVGAGLAPNSTAEEALELLRSRKTRMLPVLLGDQLLGILTISDFSKVTRDELQAVFVTALMTRREMLKSVEPATSATDALRILGSSGHHQLPIIDASGGFHGFVTAQGILRWLAGNHEIR